MPLRTYEPLRYQEGIPLLLWCNIYGAMQHNLWCAATWIRVAMRLPHVWYAILSYCFSGSRSYIYSVAIRKQKAKQMTNEEFTDYTKELEDYSQKVKKIKTKLDNIQSGMVECNVIWDAYVAKWGRIKR
tara:strand:+ start:168 stop:554 length:387 start_codon:yes stop_codon:yes gene_type:complete